MYPTVLAIATPPDLNVHVGVPMFSEGVIVRVRESPLLPLPVPATAMTAAEAVGCVLSITTFDPPVIAVTAVETAFPAVSVKVHEKPTVPSASPSAIVTAAVWWSVSVTVP